MLRHIHAQSCEPAAWNWPKVRHFLPRHDNGYQGHYNDHEFWRSSIALLSANAALSYQLSFPVNTPKPLTLNCQLHADTRTHLHVLWTDTHKHIHKMFTYYIYIKAPKIKVIVKIQRAELCGFFISWVVQLIQEQCHCVSHTCHNVSCFLFQTNCKRMARSGTRRHLSKLMSHK